MCNFHSSLLLSNGDLLYNSSLRSHEDLIDFFNIRDTELIQGKFIRLEFKPDNDNDYLDINKYKLCVDETQTPNWFYKYREQTIEKLKDIAGKKIITTNQKILCDGIYIIGKNVVVDRVVNAEIFVNYGTVTRNYGTVTNNNGTVTRNYGTVTNNNNGTVTVNYGTVTDNYSTVTDNYSTVTVNL